MTTKYLGAGNITNITAPTGGVTKDTLYATGDRALPVLETAAAGAKVGLAMEGEFQLTKKAGSNLDFSIGEKVYALTTGGAEVCVPVTGGGTEAVGWATAAAATGDTTVNVKLGGW